VWDELCPHLVIPLGTVRETSAPFGLFLQPKHHRPLEASPSPREALTAVAEHWEDPQHLSPGAYLHVFVERLGVGGHETARGRQLAETLQAKHRLILKHHLAFSYIYTHTPQIIPDVFSMGSTVDLSMYTYGPCDSFEEVFENRQLV